MYAPPPHSKKWGNIALHMSVGRYDCRSVVMSVTFFVSWSITRERLDLPSLNSVHTFILGSRGTLLILRSHGQMSRVPVSTVPKVFKCLIPQNEFLLHTFVQLILSWLIRLYKTLVTKKLKRAYRLQTSLVLNVLQPKLTDSIAITIDTRIVNIEVC